jgi:cyclic nucleotide gated channel alpha 3
LFGLKGNAFFLRNCCAYFLICQYLGFGTDQWVLPASANNETVAMLYTYCFYWSTLLLSTIGDVPLPVERVEYVFVLFDYMIGMFSSEFVVFEVHLWTKYIPEHD